MSENWKPGDVAMVRFNETTEAVAMLTDRGDLAPLWIAGNERTWARDGEMTARRLPVPDPENAEDMERLAAIYASATNGDLNDYPLSVPALHMQAALREFANPTPPIEEPGGPFAVVQDANGARWLLAQDVDGLAPWNRIGTDVWASWSEIATVRVLSVGVTP